MAAAEGPAGDGEPWQSWLPNHAVFLRLREGLKSQSQSQSPAEAEKPTCSPSPSSPPLLTRNLVLGLGGELFLWDADDSSFLVVRLRGLGGGGEEPSLSQYQVRPSAGACPGFGSPAHAGRCADRCKPSSLEGRPTESGRRLSSSFWPLAASLCVFVPSSEAYGLRHR